MEEFSRHPDQMSEPPQTPFDRCGDSTPSSPRTVELLSLQGWAWPPYEGSPYRCARIFTSRSISRQQVRDELRRTGELNSLFSLRSFCTRVVQRPRYWEWRHNFQSVSRSSNPGAGSSCSETCWGQQWRYAVFTSIWRRQNGPEQKPEGKVKEQEVSTNIKGSSLNNSLRCV